MLVGQQVAGVCVIRAGLTGGTFAPALGTMRTITGNKDRYFPGNFPPQLELISCILAGVFSPNRFGNTA